MHRVHPGDQMKCYRMEWQLFYDIWTEQWEVHCIVRKNYHEGDNLDQSQILLLCLLIVHCCVYNDSLLTVTRSDLKGKHNYFLNVLACSMYSTQKHGSLYTEC